MRRSSGQCGYVHRRGTQAVAVGLMLLAIAGCAPDPDAVSSPSPATPPGSTQASPAPGSPTPSPSPTPSSSSSPSPSPTTVAPSPGTPTPPTPSVSPPPASTAPPASPSAPVPSTSALLQVWAGQDIEAFDTPRKVVALTFDGGASGEAVESILATLETYRVPATFFVTGAFARAYPGSVTAMAAAGHPVGNHSDTHPYFTQTTNEEIRAELAAAERSISALTGATTTPLFRFPYGDLTDLDIRVVNAAGYIPVRWTVDTLGWKGTSAGITTSVVRQRVLDRLRPGQIVLMHVGAHPEDNSTLDADALPGIIEDLRARGYGFTTLPDLLDDAL